MAVLPTKKVIKKGGGHHGGSWKVAYADFVTAMMALFMVLWIMSQGPEVKQSIAAYFTDPRGMPVVQTNTSLLNNPGSGVLDQLPAPRTMGGGTGSGPAYMKLMQAKDKEKKDMEEVAKQIKKKLEEKPELAKLAKMVQVQVTNEGLRIELIDQVAGTFFEIGSSNPKESLRLAIQEIVKASSTLENDVIIEGHTDARPYPGGLAGYSNWELSADRGNAVRRLMTTMGFPTERVTGVRAYAETMPLSGTDPLDARNRRVSILLQSRFSNVPEGEVPAESPTPEE